MAQREYEEESDEVKQEVEEHRQIMRDGGIDAEVDGRYQEFQRYYFSLRCGGAST